jgi:putative redox protein
MQLRTISIQKDIHQISTEWKGNMHFESTVNGHALRFDKLPKHGGDDKGPRPKPVFLASIAGCSGMEIILILEKMHVRIEGLRIEIAGELNDGQPKVYKSVHVIYKVSAQASDQQKIERAINLAVEKYCGIISMVRQFANFTSEVIFT